MAEDEIQRCLYCNSSNCRRIVRKGLQAMLQRGLGRVPYFCRACVKVFYAPRPESKVSPESGPQAGL